MEYDLPEEMIGIPAVLALVIIEETTLVIPRDASPLRVPCPVHETTRIVFPEALHQVKALEREMRALGLEVERLRPQGVIALRPISQAARGTLELRGPTLVVRLLLEATATGSGSELRLALEPEPRSEAVEARPSPAPAPQPAAPPPVSLAAAASPPPLADPAELLRARTVAIGRREGLPGQRSMLLVDALHGERWVWLRFRLEGGAGAHVDRVWWGDGDVAGVVQEDDGDDLRILVPLPKARVGDKTRVLVKVAPGPPYKFALKPSTLPNFFKELFR